MIGLGLLFSLFFVYIKEGAIMTISPVKKGAITSKVSVDLDKVPVSFEKWSQPGHFSKVLLDRERLAQCGETNGPIGRRYCTRPVRQVARCLLLSRICRWARRARNHSRETSDC